jgi:O-antigen/teichoic acid export membrane protein
VSPVDLFDRGDLEPPTPPPRPGGRDHLIGVARDGFIKLAGSVSAGIFGFLFIMVVARGLGPAGTGVFYEAVALYLIASSLAKLGADAGATRMIARYRALERLPDLRRTVTIALIPVLLVATGLGAAMFVLAPRIAELVADGRHVAELVPSIRVLAPFISVTAGSAVLLAASRGFQTMVPLVVVNNIARPILRPVLAVVVLALGMGGIAVALAYAVPVALGFVAALVWVLRLLRRAEEPSLTGPLDSTPTPRLASDFWRFAAPRAFAAVFSTTVTWLDTLLLGELRSTVDAGVYNGATRYLKLGSFALTVLYLVTSPRISALLATNDREGAGTIYRTTTGWLMLTSWPVYMTLAMFAPVLLSVFGPGFVEGQTALTILALAMLVSMAAGPASPILLMAGHSVANTTNSAVALVLNVGLNLVLIPRYGMTGAAIAWAVSIVVNNVAAVVELWLLERLTPFGAAPWIVAAASAGCFGVLGLLGRWVLGSSLAGLLVTGSVAAAAYLWILWRHRAPLELPVLAEALRGRVRRRGGRRPRPMAERRPRGDARR